MYPAEELTRLAARKLELQREIADYRQLCVQAAARATQPLEWIDRAIAFWRKLSPLAKLAALPLGFLIKRTVLPRMKIVGLLVRWAPLIFSVVRGMRTAAKARSASARA